ncbi:MAG: PQQ-binding-like beta-propeller repeat protein [Planctomycetia bacterium]|nr:PQQ-binding-like beta-propeller repeat protein [Planctomycetia bacterium]
MKTPSIATSSWSCRSSCWIIVLFAASFAQAAEPAAYFRADAGVAADSKPLVEKFDDSTLLWRQPLAPGHSTPCVCGDSIFLTTFENKELATVALDRRTGKPRWRQVAPARELETFHPTGSPAAATAACDGRRVFTFFGSYGLLCYDLDGKLLWSKPMGPFQDEFGSGSSPILVDGKLILNEDHDRDSFLLAVDPATGDTIWKTAREGFTRSYATPVVWTLGGRRQLIVAGALQLVAYDVETGRQLWSMDGMARIVNTTPAIDGEMLYVATWSPGGDTDARIGMESWESATKQWDKNADGRLARDEVSNPEVLDRFFRIDLNQDRGLDEGEWKKYARVFELAKNSIQVFRPTTSASEPSADVKKMEVVWQYQKGLPYVPSPLVYRKVVYLVKDGGILTTLDAANGKLLKTGRLPGAGNYMASPIAGDGKVYLLSERGSLNVLAAGGKWDILSTHDFAERTVASPVIADDRIYIRTEQAVYCLGAKTSP